MSTPTSYVDLFYSPGSLDEATPPPEPRRLIVAIIALPLFFIVTFVMASIGSAHAPSPNHLSLTIAGPSATTTKIAAGIERQGSDRFDITQTADSADAAAHVERRDAVGAVIIEPTASGGVPTVTVVTAGAGGRQAAAAVQKIGDAVAAQLNTTAELRDVAPTDSEDGAGAGLFFLLVMCTMGAYLSISGVFRGLPGIRRRLKLLVTLAVSIVTPVANLVALSPSYGFFGMDVRQTAALVGVASLYTLTVALLSVFFHELVGGAAVFLVVLVCLAFNLPTSGGTTPASMLPAFWQAISDIWFGSGAMQTFQSVVYFDGQGVGEPLTRLVIWLAGTAVALGLTYLVTSRKSARHR